MNKKNKKQAQKKVINTGAAQNTEVQQYIKTKVEQAKKEIEKIEKDILEFDKK